MAVFRQTSWPIFDQDFGRFSAKVLVRFRPKFWSDFGQNLGRFPTKKMPSWMAPTGLVKRPLDATLAVTNFYRKPSQLSRQAFRILRAKPFLFFCLRCARNQKIFALRAKPKKWSRCVRSQFFSARCARNQIFSARCARSQSTPQPSARQRHAALVVTRRSNSNAAPRNSSRP